jgi:hypothetical protein
MVEFVPFLPGRDGRRGRLEYVRLTIWAWTS